MSENSVSYSGTSSICSNMSNMSINYLDTEMELEDAVDYIFKELQEHINQTHVNIRDICQWDLKDQDYDEVYPHFEQMTNHIKEGSALFKDLIKVIKQILPPKPKVPKTIKE